MNYYEELDVSPAASVNEIRHAYKSLARLVHPDQCSDENLRRLAELQMKRLNEILSVLTDSEARRQYDACLKAPARQRSEVGPQVLDRPLQRRWIIGLCAWLPPATVLMILLAALLYYGTENRQEARVSVPANLPPDGPVSRAVVTPDPPHQIPDTAKEPRFEDHKVLVRLRSAGGQAGAPGAARQQMPDPPLLPTPPSERDESALEPYPAALRTIAEARLPVSERMDQTVERAAPSSPRLAGHWYYVPAGRAVGTDGRYLPEYIELHLLESAGVLKGRYVARYRVTDRAIDPNVVFEFEGAGSAPEAQFSWKGPGDASGKVSLRLTAADRLEVSWMATHLSAELNLASGNAQLIRQKER